VLRTRNCIEVAWTIQAAPGGRPSVIRQGRTTPPPFLCHARVEDRVKSRLGCHWSRRLPKEDREKAELEFLLASARAGRAAGAHDLEHLNGAAAAFNYIRIANLVASLVATGDVIPPVLDWGCGYGQVSWLLQKRAVGVASYDVEPRPARQRMKGLDAIEIQYGEAPALLPYAPATFGAVLSVGVLEHVPDMNGSLREINRVLRPGGMLLLFMLPNRYSWSEWIAARRKTSVHPVKFTFRSTTKLLAGHGFAVEKRWKRNLLPRNLTGFPPRLKALYGCLYREIEILDRFLANVPPASYLSGVLEFQTRKQA